MGEIIYAYSRLTREFGRPADFQDYPPETLADIFPNFDVAFQYTRTDPYETEIQCVVDQSEQATNTERKRLGAKGQFHQEGGWPKEIDILEEEHKVRYRKKAEKEDAYLVSARHLVHDMELYIKQNSAIDIYLNYFAEDPPTHYDNSQETSGVTSHLDMLLMGAGTPSAKLLTILNDPTPTRKRSAASLSWLPNDGKKIAVAYCNSGFPVTNSSSLLLSHGESVKSFIWDITNPNTPDFTIEPPNPMTCVQYNPKEAYTIAGGLSNGLLCIFDVRQKGTAVLTSRVEGSHRHAVRDVKWLQTKPTECMTTAADGAILFWDTKKISEPIDSILLRPKGIVSDEGDPATYGGLCFDYNPFVGGQSKFMVGTEQGAAITCTSVYAAHHGPVYAVERNVQCPKYFLTVGDWRAQIWMEDIRIPILSTRYHATYLTAGLWHPARAGVFMTTRMDGTLDIWDLTYKHNDPLFSMQVSDQGLHSLALHPFGRLVAVSGAVSGTFLLELSPSLYTPIKDERAIVNTMLERETLRERNLIQRGRELKQRNRRQADTDDFGLRGDRDEMETSADSFTAAEQQVFNSLTREYITLLEANGIETSSLKQKAFLSTGEEREAPIEKKPTSEIGPEQLLAFQFGQQ
eukprot:TRINITY_DN3349_c0_g1_i3.p1 TRINITY_DN3349_c0_g1~~TRINITY_DN3349_c0_g1_i3.p1  ORF type:complete len:632 (+),score=63.91 TRINITY_DN3349_c0_g1_i3:1713-3608(+)